MSYSQGGIIAATDYNTIVGTSPSSTPNQINTVWAVGNGNVGYGQTALSQVAATGVVTATQWATAINTLNSIRSHQSGSGTGIGAPTAGGLITYLSSFQSNVNAIYANALVFSAQGTTTTGTVFTANIVAANDVTYSATAATRTVTFTNGDAARYFFNAGGQINLVVTSVVNNNNTQRSADAITTISTNWGGFSAFRAKVNGQRTGTGGTLAGGGYTSGYYGLTTANVTVAQVTSSNTTYTSDTVTCLTKSNGTQGTNADAGSIITLYLNYNSAHTSGFNDALSVTLNHRIDVVYPELTNLTANTWGAVVIA